jgi:hypothetical protein
MNVGEYATLTTFKNGQASVGALPESRRLVDPSMLLSSRD